VTATENNRIAALVTRESECLCPNYKLMFECTVRSNSTEVVIIWNGSVFSSDCKGLGIRLSSLFQSNDNCNEGAFIGSIMSNENSWYISQLNITLGNFEIIGKKVQCLHVNHDDMGQIKEIGNTSITGLYH
jgi:hypothetical protein